MAEVNNFKNDIPDNSKAEEKYTSMATGIVPFCLYNFCRANGDYQSLVKRDKQVSHNKKNFSIGIDEDIKDKENLIYRKGDTEVVIEYPISDNSSNKLIEKFLILIMIYFPYKNLFNGSNFPLLQIPLQELVDNGAYSNISNAKRGMLNAYQQIMSIRIGGKINNKNIYKQDKEGMLYNLFAGGYPKIDDNILYFDLNPQLKWTLIFKYFTYIPKVCLGLTENALSCMIYIGYILRQRIKYIEKNGYIDISFSTLCIRLFLPEPKKTTHPKRDIQDKLLNTFIEINSKCDKIVNKDFRLEPIYKSNASVSEWIRTGKLRVHITGEYANKILQNGKRQKKFLPTQTA